LKQDSLRVKKNTGFCFDTCTQINIFKNPNIGNFLTCRFDIQNSLVYIPEITLVEAERNGFEKSKILQTLSQTLGTKKIIVSPITTNMKIRAIVLEQKLKPLLHNGDSEILAFALETDSILVTYDKGLETCCNKMHGKVINPSKILVEAIAA